MSNGRIWTGEDTAILERHSGRIPAREIAALTGHTERTVLEHQRLAGLPAYAPRPKWTRRDYLLAGAANLWESAA